MQGHWKKRFCFSRICGPPSGSNGSDLLVFFSPKSTVAVLVYYTITHSFRYAGATAAAPLYRHCGCHCTAATGEPQLTANCRAGSVTVSAAHKRQPDGREGRWWAAAAAPGIRNRKECYSLLTCFWWAVSELCHSLCTFRVLSVFTLNFAVWHVILLVL